MGLWAWQEISTKSTRARENYNLQHRLSQFHSSASSLFEFHQVWAADESDSQQPDADGLISIHLSTANPLRRGAWAARLHSADLHAQIFAVLMIHAK